MNTLASPNYVSVAFYWQYNLILLGGSALFSLASRSPWPFVIGLSAEAVWLVLGPRLPAFRRSVDARLDAERRARLDDELLSGVRSLGPRSTARLLAVGQTLSLVSMAAHKRAGAHSELARAAAELERVRFSFLAFCQLDERMSLLQHELSEHPPEAEVARLARAYAAEKDLGQRLTLHRGVRAAERQVELKARLVELRALVEQQLAFVEQALRHLREQQQAGLPDADLAREMASCLSRVGSPSALEAQLSEASAPSLAPVTRAPSPSSSGYP